MNVTDVGSGTPILWIHGFPLAAAIFENQLAIRGVRHLMPDLPGFGQTPMRAITSMDDYARFALEVLDQRGIERAVFAGLSMGGYVCFAVRRIAPERMSGLVLIDTREVADTDEGRKGRFEAIEKVKQHGVAAIADSMGPKMLTADAPPAMRERVREIMTSCSAEGVIAALQAMADRPDSSDLLPKIDIPTLIVVGEEDTITPPPDAERMAKAIPESKLVKIARAAHLSNVEQADAFNEAVQNHLKG